MTRIQLAVFAASALLLPAALAADQPPRRPGDAERTRPRDAAPAPPLRLGMSAHIGASALRPTGDLWSDNKLDFGTRNSDMVGLRWGIELHYAVHPHIDLLAGVEREERNFPSAYIEYVFDEGDEIEHVTEYSFTDLTFGARFRLTPPGSPFTPWLSGGFAGSFYRYDEYGDFVDFANDQDIVYDEYQESSFLPGFFVGAGADYRLNRGWSLFGEFRLNRFAASHQDDFADYGNFTAFRGYGALGFRFRFGGQ